jgi:hypothetical protein
VFKRPPFAQAAPPPWSRLRGRGCFAQSRERDLFV